MQKNIRLNGKLIDLSSPITMGIINITPDSFYDGGKYKTNENLLQQVSRYIDEGAGIIDIGAYSSRPGARDISTEEEINRLLPALECVRQTFPHISLSIDTFRAAVISRVYDCIGPFIVNDISGGSLDEAMFETVGKLKLPYVLMHMRGNPQTMQQYTHYSNLIPDIIKELNTAIQNLERNSVTDIIIDPGIGFSKTMDQNYLILKHLEDFKILNKPILVGLSRKSLISKALQIDATDSLNATSVLHTFALQNGASILRVHDIKEANECIFLYNKIKNTF